MRSMEKLHDYTSGLRCTGSQVAPRIIAAAPWLLLMLMLAFTGSAGAEAHRVFLDGIVDDWAGLSPVFTDPVGDGSPDGADFEHVYATNDEDYFYIRFNVNADLLLQEDNEITLLMNTDGDLSTGYWPNVFGAELSWSFGTRSGFYFYEDMEFAIEWSDISLIALPGYSSEEFEVRIYRYVQPDDEHLLFPNASFQFGLKEFSGGDLVPDGLGYIDYTFDDTGLDPLVVNELAQDPGSMRLMTYNVHFDDLWDSYNSSRFHRILDAIDPDVIAFQEIYNHSAASTANLMESWLGGNWDATKFNDLIVCTRGTIIDTWYVVDDRAGAYLLSPLGDLTENLLVIDLHLKCCAYGDSAREYQCDAIMDFIRDAKTPGGEIDISPETPIIITGDTNFVGSSRALGTLLTGDIVDEATHGADFAPDWDDTDFTDLISRVPAHPSGYTWYNGWSNFWPSRLDLIIYSDSNISVGNHGVLQTTFLPDDFLTANGLQRYDSNDASDHLPHYADFQVTQQTVEPPMPPAQSGMRLKLAGNNPIRASARLLLELPASGGGDTMVSVQVLDATGRQVREMRFDSLPAGRHTIEWDGRDRDGQQAPGGVYWVRCLAGANEAGTRVILVR
jgi:exonuclease III